MQDEIKPVEGAQDRCSLSEPPDLFDQVWFGYKGC